MKTLNRKESKVKVLCIGFGNVARSLARLLIKEPSRSRFLPGLDLQFVGVTSASRGSLENAQGLDLSRALQEIEESGRFQGKNPDFSKLNSLEAVQQLDYDVLIELSTLNLNNKGKPALTYMRTALERGKHCVTANKGPIAFAYQELASLARKNHSRLLFESTVMDGAPVFNMARTALKGCRVVAVEGILNSTGNYVLTQIEQGTSFDEAILKARQGGFAEADPSHDLEGWDAAAKISILARVLMDAEITPTEVSRKGFSTLDLNEISQTVSAGTRVKMVARARIDSGKVLAEVGPEHFPINHPFATVDGTGNILRIETDLMCPLTIRQESPSVKDTAYGVLNDLIELGAGG